jgi:MYXO-CTERM domain-containing protein
MKTCAAGALLFGGTLGASAQAATVIDDFATGFGSSGTSSTQSGAGILGTRMVTNGPGCLLSFRNPGMNWTGDAYNYSGVKYFSFGTLNFTNTALTVTGSGRTSGSISLMVMFLDSNGRWGSLLGTIGSSFTMSTSNLYQQQAGFNLASISEIRLNTTGSGSLDYKMTNFSYSAVPAPGAAALVGLAGLVGRRRRRN